MNTRPNEMRRPSRARSESLAHAPVVVYSSTRPAANFDTYLPAQWHRHVGAGGAGGCGGRLLRSSATGGGGGGGQRDVRVLFCVFAATFASSSCVGVYLGVLGATVKLIRIILAWHYAAIKHSELGSLGKEKGTNNGFLTCTDNFTRLRVAKMEKQKGKPLML